MSCASWQVSTSEMGLYWPRLHIGFSEEVEVPAVTKKDCGCCSYRDSMDKDSVRVLFQPSAWQKIRGFLCFRVRLVGCGPGLELSQESTQELEGCHPAALLECVPPLCTNL